MRLSNETLAVLKNFSNINQNLEFKAGNKLTTISTTKSVLAQAVLNDTFPQSFCVYDLNKFLSAHALFKDSELKFKDNVISFSSDRKRINFTTAARDVIMTAPDKELKMESVDCSFTLSEDDYSDIMKAVNIFGSPNIVVQSDGENINLVACNSKDESQNSMVVEVGEGNGKKFNIVFKAENIKMIQGEYLVEIAFKGFASFKNIKHNIQYWVAFESSESTY
jgi:gp45 sliding clamp, C terminal